MNLLKRSLELKSKKSLLEAFIFYIITSCILIVISSTLIIGVGIITQNFSIEAAHIVSSICIFSLQVILALKILKIKEYTRDYALLFIVTCSGIFSLLGGFFIGNIFTSYLTTLKHRKTS